MSEVRSGHGENTTGLLIEAVNNSGTKVAVDRRQSAEMMQKRVHQSSRMMARAGVNHHSGGLIHDDDVRILIKDLERQFFWFGAKRRRRRGRHRDSFAAFDGIRGSASFAIHQN